MAKELEYLTNEELLEEIIKLSVDVEWMIKFKDIMTVSEQREFKYLKEKKVLYTKYFLRKIGYENR